MSFRFSVPFIDPVELIREVPLPYLQYPDSREDDSRPTVNIHKYRYENGQGVEVCTVRNVSTVTMRFVKYQEDSNEYTDVSSHMHGDKALVRELILAFNKKPIPELYYTEKDPSKWAYPSS